MFGGVLDAEQLGDLCAWGLQRPIVGSMLPVIRSNSRLTEHPALLYQSWSDARSRREGRIEIMLDGGIRRGSDVVQALAMGARAVLVGRAYAYGLGAAGGAGVHRAIEIVRSDIIRTLKLLGCSSVAELDRSYVSVPLEWETRRDARFLTELGA
jgi:hypothetical protein